MAAYARAHLDDNTRRKARRAIHSARYWREEADAPMCIFSARRCRAEMRAALADAARLRRQLIALRDSAARYVTRDEWRAIKTAD